MASAQILKAKATQIQLEYTKDLQRVALARQAEQATTKVLSHKEREFWRATLQSSSANYPVAGDTSALFDRLVAAHRELTQARRDLSESKNALNDARTSLSCTQERLDSLNRRLTKCSQKRSARRSEAVSDELSELSVQARHSTSLRSGELNPLAADTALSATPAPRAVGAHPSLPLVRVPISAAVFGTGNSPLLLGDVSVSSLESANGLAVRCNISGLGPISISLSQNQTTGVKVVLEAQIGAPLSTLLRERATVQARLNRLGVQLHSLEIKPCTVASRDPGAGRTRRYIKEQDNEDSIP